MSSTPCAGCGKAIADASPYANCLRCGTPRNGEAPVAAVPAQSRGFFSRLLIGCVILVALAGGAMLLFFLALLLFFATVGSGF